jgi:mevalonate kinase
MTLGSAPGKIILFGEHAVVYGRPALAVPVTQVQAQVEVLDSPQAGIWIEAPDIGVHAEMGDLPPGHPLAAAISGTLQALDPPLALPPFLRNGGSRRGVEIQIASTIPVASGLGSGAAVSVALIRALSTHLGRPLTDEQVSAIAYEVEKIHHGTPSGIDNNVVAYARPVYYVRGQPAETFGVGAPFTLVIGDTGLPAPTKESVGDVRRLWEADEARWEKVFDEIGQIVQRARHMLQGGAWVDLGDLMDANHALLQELAVSSPELDRLVLAARSAGALGAKMSGGGRGGNMIALVSPEAAGSVAAALKNAGAVRTIITTVQ